MDLKEKFKTKLLSYLEFLKKENPKLVFKPFGDIQTVANNISSSWDKHKNLILKQKEQFFLVTNEEIYMVTEFKVGDIWKTLKKTKRTQLWRNIRHIYGLAVKLKTDNESPQLDIMSLMNMAQNNDLGGLMSTAQSLLGGADIGEMLSNIIPEEKALPNIVEIKDDKRVVEQKCVDDIYDSEKYFPDEYNKIKNIEISLKTCDIINDLSVNGKIYSKFLTSITIKKDVNLVKKEISKMICDDMWDNILFENKCNHDYIKNIFIKKYQNKFVNYINFDNDCKMEIVIKLDEPINDYKIFVYYIDVINEV